MKREELTALGVSDEILDQIMTMHGKDVERQKQTITALTAERDGLQQQLTAANGKLEGYDPAWKAKAEQAQKEAEQRIADMQFDTLLDSAISGAKGRNAKAIRALLDTEALRASKNQDGDIRTALEALRAESDYLFEPDKPAPIFSGPTPGAPLDGMDAIRAAAGLKTDTK